MVEIKLGILRSIVTILLYQRNSFILSYNSFQLILSHKSHFEREQTKYSSYMDI